jgi:N-acetylmuramoyl-L-alanine amidase
MYEHDGMYKYTTGNDTSLQQANKLKEELIKKGFTDIFVVAFLNEQRIPIEEAKQLTENKK